MELTERLLLIMLAQKKLAEDLYKTGYPENYPEQYANLAAAYEKLDGAFNEVVLEEAEFLTFIINQTEERGMRKNVKTR